MVNHVLASMIKFLTITFCLLLLVSDVISQTGWSARRSGTSSDLVAVYFTSDAIGWIAGDNGYLASTSDGGRTWKTYPLNTTEDINEIYFRNERNGYLVAGRKLFVTNDAGASWRETSIYRASDFKNGTPELLSIRFADRRRGLAVGSILNRKGSVIDSLVMRTEDGGETWQRIV